MADNSTWRAVLIGASPDKDLAVLQIDAPKPIVAPYYYWKIERPAGRPESICHWKPIWS